MDGMIDLVYTWCDSADPVWNAKRQEAARACGLAEDAVSNAPCRFAAHDELRYSLRSAECSVPWIRKVFLVVDDDIALPRWLKTDHPRMEIVRLSEIMPPEALPCFCSPNIEHHIVNIPGLAERFLYANDDMMFYRKLEPSFFFHSDGSPIFRFRGRPKREDWEPKNAYHARLKRAEDLVRAGNGRLPSAALAAMSRFPHHNVDAYCKADVRDVFQKYRKEISATFAHPFRLPDNVQRVIYAYEALVRGHGHYRLASGGLVNRLRRLGRLPCADSLQFVRGKWRTGPEELRRCRPGLFCFNDTLETTDRDRAWLDGVYDDLYPQLSSFERSET